MAIKAGKKAKLLCTGSKLSFTTEATTSTGNLVYQIDATTKRIWDRTEVISVLDGGVPTVEAYTLNRLEGKVTFGSATARVITVTGYYLPTTEIGSAKDYSYSIKANNEDVTEFGKSYINRKQALLDFTCSISQFSIDDVYQNFLVDGTPMVIEFYSDKTVVVAPNEIGFDLKAWVIPSSNDNSGAVDGVVEESLEFEGTTDDDRRCITINEHLNLV